MTHIVVLLADGTLQTTIQGALDGAGDVLRSSQRSFSWRITRDILDLLGYKSVGLLVCDQKMLPELVGLMHNWQAAEYVPYTPIGFIKDETIDLKKNPLPPDLNIVAFLNAEKNIEPKTFIRLKLAADKAKRNAHGLITPEAFAASLETALNGVEAEINMNLQELRPEPASQARLTWWQRKSSRVRKFLRLDHYG